ncbi:MAG: hypothetical protein HY821_23815 [Acidobacteria bacterium]|nr:hypothetical protein [Acidobacteriota bacterium]
MNTSLWNYLRWPIATTVGFGVGWLITRALGLPSEVAWIVRMFCAALGAGLFAAWEARRSSRASSSSSSAPAADPLWEARRRWAARGAGQPDFSSLPAIFLLGDRGSAKTSTIMNSALDAELLSGAVFQDGGVAPTADLNVWVARNTSWIEAGGSVSADPSRWAAFCRSFRSRRNWKFWTGATPPPRSAILCVNLDVLVHAGSSGAEQFARMWHARLRDLASSLAAPLPVYVLFTHGDRLPYFVEYFSTLTAEEARLPFGATLPELSLQTGAYSENQTARINAELNTLFYRLSDFRRTVLGRENDDRKWPAIYEYPREFRKLRSLLTSFLVEAFRPSQVQQCALMRGFYFSGVRPVELRQEPLAQRAAPGWGSSSSEATGLFSGSRRAEQWSPLASAQGAGVRRVPGWLFLPGLFHNVLLTDSIAQTAAMGTPARRRRGAAIAAFALCALLTVFFSVSFVLNRQAIARVASAAASIGSSRYAPGQPVSLVHLQQLNQLHAELSALRVYAQSGAPFFQRWGLDQTPALLDAARPLYFRKFDAIQRDATLRAILSFLQNLPASPGPNDEYGPAYTALKSYLIITAHPDKSTPSFLAPALTTHWRAGWSPDPSTLSLGNSQFHFYAGELLLGNPYSRQNDSAAIERARRYLAGFGAAERIYQAMLAETGRKAPVVNFNRLFPGSAQAVVNNRDILGAFSRGGYALMTDAIRHVERYMQGEEWVLGPQAYARLAPDAIERQLLERYSTEFAGQWRQYLKQSYIVRYSSPADAARKLGLLAGNQSPLLRLFCLASIHTSPAHSALKDAFQPVQYTTPPACESQLPSENNQAYLNGLLSLQSSLEQLGSGPRDELRLSRIASEADSARIAARRLAQNFRPDAEGDVDRQTLRLLEEPITQVIGMVGALGPAEVNSNAAKLCSDLHGLLNKYPFNTASRTDATLEELNSVFRPNSGSLWVFYQNHMQTLLTRQGAEYVPSGSGSMRVTPAFLQFFNRAVAFSDALYGASGTQPRLDFSLKAMPVDGVKGLVIQLDGQTLRSSGSGGASKNFTWPGPQPQAQLSANLGGGDLGLLEYSGVFAVFRLFGDADRWRPITSGYEFNWQPRQGQSNQPMTTSAGKPLTIQYQADFGRNAPIFAKGYLSGFSCAALAVR